MPEMIARCSIYEDRPKVCREYPEIDSWRPPECTYAFINGERVGRCACNVGACCAVPREKGLPGGAHLPEEAGGLPCQFLELRAKEKTAAVDERYYPTAGVAFAAALGET